MPEVKIDELYVASISQLPPEVNVDEVYVVALKEYIPAINVDNLYARGIAEIPASITFNGIHAGAVRSANLPTRFKEGYKKEVLDTLANVVGTALSVDNYDIELKGLNQNNPRATNLRLSARKVSTYRRYSDVVYQRADATKLGPLINYDLLKPTEAWPLDTTAQIVARINTLFGTTLTDIDFVEEATPVGADRYLTAKDTSFYFHPGTKLNIGRLDAGNERSTEVTGLNRNEYGFGSYTPYRVHSSDWSAYAADLNAAGTVINSTTGNAIVTMLNAVHSGHGFVNQVYTSTTTGYGIRNAPCQVLTLPAVTDAPVDNSGYYNRALVIDLALSPWFTNFRWLIFHYNV